MVLIGPRWGPRNDLFRNVLTHHAGSSERRGTAAEVQAREGPCTRGEGRPRANARGITGTKPHAAVRGREDHGEAHEQRDLHESNLELEDVQETRGKDLGKV